MSFRKGLPLFARHAGQSRGDLHMDATPDSLEKLRSSPRNAASFGLTFFIAMSDTRCEVRSGTAALTHCEGARRSDLYQANR